MATGDDSAGALRRTCDGCARGGLLAGGLLSAGAYLGLILDPSYFLLPLLALNLLALACSLAAALRLGKLVWREANLSRTVQGAFLAYIVATLAFWCAECMLPATARDALIYHLFMPRKWLEQGRIMPLMWHTWSFFPLLGSVAYGGLLQLGWEPGTQFYHGIFWILTSLLSAGLGRSAGHSPRAALFSAAAIFSTPLCVRLAGEPMGEWFLAFYSVIALYYALQWWNAPSRADLVKIGAALGMMLSVKYTGLLAVALMGGLLLLAILLQCDTWRSRLLAFLTVCWPALLLVGPWLGRNWILTGDPLYPFLGGEQASADEYAFVGSLPPLLYRHVVYGESWLQIALIPVRMVIAGADGSTRTFDGVLTPFYLILILPIIAWRHQLRRYGVIAAGILLTLVAHVLLAPTLHHFVTRYHASILGVVVVVAGWGLDLLLGLRPAWLRNVAVSALVASHLVVASTYGVQFLTIRQIAPYLLGHIDRDQYLDAFASEMKAARLLSRALPKTTRTFLVYTGNQYYLYDRDVRGAYASATPFLTLLPHADGACRLAQDFHDDGITHLLIFNSRLANVVRDLLPAQPTLAREWGRFFGEVAFLETEEEGLSLWRLQACPAVAGS